MRAYKSQRHCTAGRLASRLRNVTTVEIEAAVRIKTEKRIEHTA